jgi:hypothetical protein
MWIQQKVHSQFPALRYDVIQQASCSACSSVSELQCVFQCVRTAVRVPVCQNCSAWSSVSELQCVIQCVRTAVRVPVSELQCVSQCVRTAVCVPVCQKYSVCSNVLEMLCVCPTVSELLCVSQCVGSDWRHCESYPWTHTTILPSLKYTGLKAIACFITEKQTPHIPCEKYVERCLIKQADNFSRSLAWNTYSLRIPDRDNFKSLDLSTNPSFRKIPRC